MGREARSVLSHLIAPSWSLTFRPVDTSVRSAELLAAIESCHITAFEDGRTGSQEPRNLLVSL